MNQWPHGLGLQAKAGELRNAASALLGWYERDEAVLQALHDRYLTADAPGAPRCAADVEKILLADLRVCISAYDALAAARSPVGPVVPASSDVDSGGVTADGHVLPPLRFDIRNIELNDENSEIDTDQVRDALTAEYEAWLEQNGLNLGSADEHVLDTSLTLEQLNWVREFTRRWDENEALADAQRRSMNP